MLCTARGFSHHIVIYQQRLVVKGRYGLGGGTDWDALREFHRRR